MNMNPITVKTSYPLTDLSIAPRETLLLTPGERLAEGTGIHVLGMSVDLEAYRHEAIAQTLRELADDIDAGVYFPEYHKSKRINEQTQKTHLSIDAL